MGGQYNRKDHYYNQAKSEGYRSRAAFKLIELNKRFQILKKGHKVLDLGAWPGGWMQVAAEIVGLAGVVVGIDLEQIEEFGDNNVKIIHGDVREEANIVEALGYAGGSFDVVVSDMSPKLSGIKEVDRFAAVGCAELALWVCEKVLRAGGDLVIKVFKSNEAEEFIRNLRRHFNKVSREQLDSSRKTSNEFYVVAYGYKRESIS